MGNTSMFNWIFSVKLIIVIIASFWTLLSAQPSLGENTSQSSSQMLFKRRMRRATDCTMGFISGEMTSNSLRLASYSASQLDACLNNNVLLANLTQLGQIAFSRDQLLVLKEKLGEIYTGGLPEERIRQLGFIITVYGPEEISMWNITNADTLTLVLNNSPNLNTSKAIISNYLQRSGPLDAVALDAIGGPLLCTLSEENLRTILPSELKKAKPLNISMCTQAKKDILFGIAKVAFQDLAGDPKAYFNQLKPYIGGARASDLQRLAPGNISMDFQTFSSLNPVEVEKLTVQNIRDLLGINLNSLKENEDHEIVRRWVNSHTVDEVTSLGIGLRGGISPAGLGNFSFQELPGSASVNSYNLLLSICITVMGITLQHLS
ncbi:mesothelin-like protein [Chiloscyllium plagiosum]|uniref:mesothelin-like protein n=1 Tax=Chiloscyllium plagiosum TaxID=36176 RepID=UPI001CB85FDB|nr:mesothelin-like protein [Chiloscyllium plagiosum]XP_043567188.1 mesothelin-like protein [Chiloscyllium plagiosum]XP_043567189.1 mesothelin-like protein [Chiloscyllium plagiosum]